MKENKRKRKVSLQFLSLLAARAIVASRRRIETMGRTVAHVLKFVMAITFIGWLMMWIVMPTNLWRRQWRVQLRARTNSTYFGTSGANILVYCFPMMLISVLGCMYLHLKEKDHSPSGRVSNKKRRINGGSWWTRPFLVKGPLGVISALELALALMFVALLIWCFTVYLGVNLPKITKAEDGAQLWQAKLERASSWLGIVGVLCAAFLFIPVSRGSVLLKLAGLTFEESVKYHIWLGHIVMTILTVHGTCFIIIWTCSNELHKFLEWANDDVSNVAGELALFFGICMWITTLPWIRRKMFELFFYTHQLYVLFVVFFVFHVGTGVLYMLLPGLYLFIVDRFLRFMQSRQSVRLVSARILPCEAVELSFSKKPGLSHSPMSTVFINVPSISRLQWHPFTVTSSSSLEPEKLSVAIKCEGQWTGDLYEKLSSAARSGAIDGLEVLVEGPYGPPSTDFLRYDTLVMVSGGAGITPFISIIRHLISRNDAPKEPARLLLICAFRNARDLAMLDLLLPASTSSSDLCPLQLQIEAFVTREQGRPESQALLQTVCFKPTPGDMPISWTLGPNHWLWLGTLISSSFLLFLVLVGCFTRFHTYPREHGTKYVYPVWLKGLFVMFFMCLSVVVVGVAVILWNKRKEPMVDRQVRSMEMEAPTANRSSWLYDDGRELASWPNQCSVENVQVHYGARPDFKKMLRKSEGSSTGVLVCGPTTMRSDVAAICSSATAKNLHYHSINFDW
ncbi:ferric reduction oxidase 2-like [Nymphaea colorata]|nr:ferric reduction oxidase 2-like [Nymphaea colorata]XP_031483419.1 ferric reduction oxidase 2-like [Nymphaea colorata]XP_031483420.1 ferric reduction oxidase 2-like [Nymphaea colorata]XP_031483422.1 ferric reduction oxidase 2-like [Nymphaea colorata]XP_031483424.1 ferric reduction oxidase 2-like [Nymphaea colorata]XP_031483425.1 ferric reduction oxidase 2-like [Nymphaea colorata]XP_031483426.1 ferric reduction oxidase 2-like [Nymphaea colorata]XP_049933467.1 ferric reduction oxidase 2-like